MLYLVKLPCYDESTQFPIIVYKIGYSDNFEHRFKSYLSGNPFATVLATRSGTREDEAALHCYLQPDFQYKFGKEYYISDYNVEKIFKELPLNFSKESIRIANIRKTRIKFEILELLRTITSFTQSTINNVSKELFKRVLYSDVNSIISYYLKTNYNVDLNGTIDIPSLEKDLIVKKEFREKDFHKLKHMVFFKKNSDALLKFNQFVEIFVNNGYFKEKMKIYCEFCDICKNEKIIKNLNNILQDNRYFDYYNMFGTDGCRARKFNEKAFKEDFFDKSKSPLINRDIIEAFPIGQRFTSKYIKQVLRQIYLDHKINKTPKATDLFDIFEMSRIKVEKEGEFGFDNGFRILGLKQ